MNADIDKHHFTGAFERLSRTHNAWQVWNDLLTFSVHHLQMIDDEDDEYKSMKEVYQPNEMRMFKQMYAFIIRTLSNNPDQDLLGFLYQELDLHQKSRGQFFTPYSVSKLICQFTCQFKKEQNQKGYVTVNDPTCGSGSLLIAQRNLAISQGINPSKELFMVAQDIDPIAAKMCFIQLSILQCSAFVIVGDTLSKPLLHPENKLYITPSFYKHHEYFTKNIKEYFTEDETGQIRFMLHTNHPNMKAV